MAADGRSREEKVIIAAQLQSALQCFASCVDEDFEVVEILASEASLMSASLSTALCACEDEETRQDPVAIDNFVAVTVALYSQLEFRQHFRLSRSTFEVG